MNISQRFISVLALMAALSFGFAIVRTTQAQTPAGGWSEPVNVSQSGGAVQPLMVVDSSGAVHILWKDVFSGYQYSHSSETGWTEPVNVVNIPLKENSSNATLYIDSEDTVHLFWLDERFRLLYSRANISRYNNLSNWGAPNILASSVTTYNVTIDLNNTAHIAYIQSKDLIDSTAGIYYAQVIRALRTRPTAIYPSPYFRTGNTASSQEAEAAIQTSLDINVSPTDEGTAVNILWSMPKARRVYLAHSPNSKDWNENVELETPEGMPGSSVPLSVLFAGTGNQQLFAIWQLTNGNGSCSTYYRSSADSGGAWNTRESLFPETSGCMENSRVLNTAEHSAIFFTEINRVVHLAVWKGTSWQLSKPQNTLSGFTNPENLNVVTMGSYQPFIRVDQVYITGSDQAAGGDVWTVAAPLEEVIKKEEEVENFWTRSSIIDASASQYFSPLLLNSGEKLHAFWSQPNDFEMPDIGAAIFQAVFTAKGDPSSSAVLQSPTGRADLLTVLLDQENRLLAVWNGGNSGEVYFSQAPAKFSQTSSDWSSPVRVTTETTKAYQPQIAASQDQIYVAFSTPINENRGVYISRSSDIGQTWTSPTQVFNAASGDCEMVGQVNLDVTGEGRVLVSWVCQTQPGGTGPIALWAAQSTNAGETWSPAAVISSDRVSWSRLIGTHGNTAHLLWKEFSNGRTHLWHSLYSSSKNQWETPTEIASLDSKSDAIAAAVDPAQQIYLVQVEELLNNASFSYWMWNGSDWDTRSTAMLEGGAIRNPADLSAVVTADGQLSILFSANSNEAATNPGRPFLFFSSHAVDIPANPIVTIMTPEPQAALVTATPQQTPTATVEILPTATVDFATILNAEPGASESSSWNGLAIGAILVIMLIGGVIFIQVRSTYSR